MNRYLPRCPYCGKRLSFLEAWGIHRDGEYCCKRCKFKSDIVFTRRRNNFGISAVVLSSVLALIFVLIGQINFFEIIVVLIPFFAFYILVPFTIFLNKNTEINNNLDENNDDSDVKKAHQNVDIFDKGVLKKVKKREKVYFDNDDIDKTKAFDDFYK